MITRKWMRDTWKDIVWKAEVQRITHIPKVKDMLREMEKAWNKVYETLPEDKDVSS